LKRLNTTFIHLILQPKGKLTCSYDIQSNPFLTLKRLKTTFIQIYLQPEHSMNSVMHTNVSSLEIQHSRAKLSHFCDAELYWRTATGSPRSFVLTEQN
jgi:hypothetical protein